jgi:hypothetical protein
MPAPGMEPAMRNIIGVAVWSWERSINQALCDCCVALRRHFGRSFWVLTRLHGGFLYGESLPRQENTIERVVHKKKWKDRRAKEVLMEISFLYIAHTLR